MFERSMNAGLKQGLFFIVLLFGGLGAIVWYQDAHSTTETVGTVKCQVTETVYHHPLWGVEKQRHVYCPSANQ